MAGERMAGDRALSGEETELPGARTSSTPGEPPGEATDREDELARAIPGSGTLPGERM